MSVDLLDKPSRSDSEKAARVGRRLRFDQFAAERGTPQAQLLEGLDHRPLVEALRQYGAYMWRTRAALGDFKSSLTAVVELRSDWRVFMKPAWDVATEWEMQEPGGHTPPLPLPAIRAALCVALLMRDFEAVAVILCAFMGGTRIGESCALTRAHILLPYDVLYDPRSGRPPVVFLILLDTKTAGAHGGAKRQHALIDDPQTVAYLVWWCTPMAPDQPLFRGSDADWTLRWQAIITKRLDIPSTGTFGFTPNCLRASHATESYLDHGSLERIRWQLRHKALRPTTLEHYIQELPAALAGATWTDQARARVEFYSVRFDSVLAAACVGRLGRLICPAVAPRVPRLRIRARSAPPRAVAPLVRALPARVPREVAALLAQNAFFATSSYWPKK